MKNYKKRIRFKDMRNELVTVEIAIVAGRLSMSGDYDGGGGQCQDSIHPATIAQGRLIQIWNKHHLNDMNAGTPKQTKALKDFDGDYTAQCEYLAQIGADSKPLTALEVKTNTHLLVAIDDKIKEVEEKRKEIEELAEICKGNHANCWVKVPEAIQRVRSFKKMNYKDGRYFMDHMFSGRRLNREVELLIKANDKEKARIEKEEKAPLLLKSLCYDKHPETGEVYKYGTSWLKVELPSDITSQLDTILADIESEGTEQSELSAYDYKAKKFLDETNTRFSTEYAEFGLYFETDTDKRAIFNVILENSRGSYGFRFGQSIVKGETPPTAYEVLACLTAYDVGSLANFCADFGYNTDSVIANKTHEGVTAEYENLKRIFSEDELLKLGEIN